MKDNRDEFNEFNIQFLFQLTHNRYQFEVTYLRFFLINNLHSVFCAKILKLCHRSILANTICFRCVIIDS